MSWRLRAASNTGPKGSADLPPWNRLLRTVLMREHIALIFYMEQGSNASRCFLAPRFPTFTHGQDVGELFPE